jgi:type III secretion protein V
MFNLKSIAQTASYIANNKEFALVIIIVFVLFMMIVPMAPEIMDAIIAFNLTATVLTLMVVVYMRSPVGLTAFPSILLVLALLRIGITVSTSRLILLDGNAGDIVNTFGKFAVGGNIVVGVIVFVIVTIINFIVITKGSERVAEVAARFSLDAMPGKQMSIDSDLKAGNLTMEQAIEKRKNLGLESKLYGAMDGAMKFVKGDSIASIVDILVNLVGGLIIGVAQKNMSFSDSMGFYSILTVGDGLVQQIPALLISLTAGMMITRVSDGDENQNLGETILTQLFDNYKAIFSAAGLLILLAFIPGMPSWVFIVFSCVFVAIGVYVFRQTNTSAAKRGADSALAEETDTDKNVSDEVQLQLLPLILYFSPKFKNSNNMKQLKHIVVSVRQYVANELGIAIPQIVIRYDQSYEEQQYQLAIFEIPEVSGTMYWNYILIMDPEAKELIKFDKMINNQLEFGEPTMGFWVSNQYQEFCVKQKIQHLTCEQFMLMHIKYHVIKHIASFLGLQEVKNILDKMNEYQELVKELLRMLPLNKIAEVFQRLIAEDISIRNFKLILDTMLEWAQREKDSVLLTEYVRRALGRYIAYKFSKGSYLFPCIIISHDLEDTIRDSIRYSDNGNYLSLDPRVNDMVVNNVKDILSAAPQVKNPVILCQFDIRRYVRSIVEAELRYLPVLSFQELEGNAQYNSMGVIEID